MIRFLARFLRGPSKPRQLYAATILGSMLAFVPDYAAQPGWAFLVLVALSASGANLPLAALVFVPAYFVKLVAMPVSFAIGQFLLDGPTSDFFRATVNAPFSALLGFEYYALTGGIPLAIVFGLLSGSATVRLVRDVRAKVDGLQEGSDRWQAVFSSMPVRVVNWILGGDWAKKEKAGIQLPWRKIATALVLVALYFGVTSVPGPFLRPFVVGGLEEYNGATVDLAGLDLDLGDGRMALTGLAMADPADLGTDLFRTELMEADISASDLLRRRVTLDRVVASEARQGAAREQRGVLVGDPPTPSDGSGGGGGGGGTGEGEKTLDDYLDDVREWKERLAQVREWLEKISGPEEETPDDPESIRDRLEREIAEKGWALVAADHLRTDAPTVLVRELAIEGLVAEDLEDDPLDVSGSHLSTHPYLVTEAPRLSVRSRSGRIAFELGLGGATTSGEGNDLLVAWHGLSTDDLLGEIEFSGTPIVSGGTLDLDLQGGWSEGLIGRIDLPLVVTLREGTWSLGGSPTEVEALALAFGLRGPIDDPRISFDDDQLQNALVAAGKSELARRVEEEASEELDELLEKGKEKLGVEVDQELEDKAKGLLKGLFGDDD